MDEVSQFNVTSSELIRNIGTLKGLLDKAEKTLQEKKKQADQYESAAETARNDYRKHIALSGDYKVEFEKSKKSEYDKLEQQKKEAKQKLEDASEKLTQAEKTLASAQSKEAKADALLVELAEKEKELEKKKELVRGFAQSFK